MARTSDGRRKLELLAGARDLIFTEGTARFTIRRLAQRAGITEAAVYRHFPCKEALLSALLAGQFEPWQAALQRLTESRARAPDRLFTLGRLHIHFLTRGRMNPLLLLSDALDPTQPALRPTLAGNQAFLGKTIHGLVSQACRSGTLDKRLDRAAATRCLVSLLQGTTVRWTLTGSTRGLWGSLARSLRLLLSRFGAAGRPILVRSLLPESAA